MKRLERSQKIAAAITLAALLVITGAALGEPAGDVHIREAAQDHSDWYRLFSHYWWLMFPLFWGIGQMLKNILRHNRAQSALEVLQSYAAQGKEPPPELVAVLRQPEREMPRISGGNFATYGWIPVFLFGALTCAFVMMGLFPAELGVPRVPMFFVAIIMAGLCIGNLVAMMARKNQDRAPPQ